MANKEQRAIRQPCRCVNDAVPKVQGRRMPAFSELAKGPHRCMSVNGGKRKSAPFPSWGRRVRGGQGYRFETVRRGELRHRARPAVRHQVPTNRRSLNSARSVAGNLFLLGFRHGSTEVSVRELDPNPREHVPDLFLARRVDSPHLQAFDPLRQGLSNRFRFCFVQARRLRWRAFRPLCV
jgi:hypothetical protein